MALSPLPPTSDFVTTGETKATFKGALSGLRAFLNSLLGSSGSQADALTGLGALLNGAVAKTGAYTVASTDRGKLIDCSGTWTLAVDAVATLGAGFAFGVRNSGSGTITINPNLSEPIDGVSTLDIGPGESCLVMVNADTTGLKTVGRSVALPAATASNDGYMTLAYAAKLDGIAAGANVGVPVDAGVAGIGTILILNRQSAYGTISSGSYDSGSKFLVANFGSGSTANLSTAGTFAPSGTWRNISNYNVAADGYGFFQRTA